MKKKVLGWYRTFIHNINYKEGYYQHVLEILIACLLICLGMIFILG